MRIGQLAKCSGTTVQTLRYYEREGILRQPARTGAGYREYGARDVEHVQFIKRCQGLGFSLKDIQQLSAMHDMGPEGARAAAGCPQPASAQQRFLKIARERLAALDERLAILCTLRSQIAKLVADAERSPANGCPAQPRQK